jgi:hypothetical protein
VTHFHKVEVDEKTEVVSEGSESEFKLERIGDDDLGEEMGEDFVRTATGGEEATEEHDEETEEEQGGPFVETSGRTEFAFGTDESNPEDAEREPLPKV